MALFLPFRYFQSVFEITPKLLQEYNISGLLLDMDGTIAPTRAAPIAGVADWIGGLRSRGIAVVLFSNNRGEHNVIRAASKLHLPYIYRAGKPSGRKIGEAVRITGIPREKLAIVGDQIFTDVLCANRGGLRALLVESLDKKIWYIRLRRIVEAPFLHRARKMRGD